MVVTFAFDGQRQSVVFLLLFVSPGLVGLFVSFLCNLFTNGFCWILGTDTYPRQPPLEGRRRGEMYVWQAWKRCGGQSRGVAEQQSSRTEQTREEINGMSPMYLSICASMCEMKRNGTADCLAVCR